MAVKTVQDESRTQDRWNSYGLETLEAVRRDPAAYAVTECPLKSLALHSEIMQILEPLEGRRVLEIGCGRGTLSVSLAKQGAVVTGMDIGPNLVEAARLVAEANKVDATFVEASATELPVEDATFDVVVGIAILHHLSRTDLAAAVREAHRVLKPGGSAVFVEPVENSAAFSFLQNLIPAGKKGNRFYRPSILSRRAWRQYVAGLEDRTLTNKELSRAGTGFDEIVLKPAGLLVRLTRILGRRHQRWLRVLDGALLRYVPPLRRYCQTLLVEYRKA